MNELSTKQALDVPEIMETDRLILRAPHPDHVAQLNAAIHESIERLRPWMPWANSLPTMAETHANLERARDQYLKREDLRLHLFLKEDGAFAGGSGLHNIDWDLPRFEIGYWVRSSFAGRGLITEAVRGITSLAFDVLGARRVEIRTSTRNEASWRVAKRAGFELEGILRNDQRHLDGSLRDTMVFARIGPERGG